MMCMQCMDGCGCDTPVHESIVQVIDERLDEALVREMSPITPKREGGEDVVLCVGKCSKIEDNNEMIDGCLHWESKTY